MSAERTCPDCGSTLPADAPRGLCPDCLMGAALPAVVLGRARGDWHRRAGRPGVLETIAQRIGPVPRVLLRDTAPGEEPGADRPPRRQATPTPSIRYRIDGEIARGGMGAVLKGRDPDLGRDLAVKVLLEDHRDNADLVRRFVEEAQIGGQLQHPGIVPIYELGTFADRRPFFTMKLVKGQHPGRAARRTGPTPADDLPRFLGDLRADLPDGGLRPRPGRDPPRPEAVERDGRQLRRGPGDGLGPGQGPAARRRRSTTRRPARPTARRR